MMHSQGCHACLNVKRWPCRMLSVIRKLLYSGTAAKRNSSNKPPKVCSWISSPAPFPGLLHKYLCWRLGKAGWEWERQGGNGKGRAGVGMTPGAGAGRRAPCTGRICYPIQPQHPGMSWGITACMGSAVVCSWQGRRWVCGGSGNCPAPTGRGQVKRRVAPATSPCDHTLQFRIKQSHPDPCCCQGLQLPSLHPCFWLRHGTGAYDAPRHGFGWKLSIFSCYFCRTISLVPAQLPAPANSLAPQGGHKAEGGSGRWGGPPWPHPAAA